MAAPFDVTIKGNNLESFGFVGGPVWNPTGLGLNTFGFLYPCDAIWQPSDFPIVTTWAACSAVGSTSIEACIHVD